MNYFCLYETNISSIILSLSVVIRFGEVPLAKLAGIIAKPVIVGVTDTCWKVQSKNHQFKAECIIVTPVAIQ